MNMDEEVPTVTLEVYLESGDGTKVDVHRVTSWTYDTDGYLEVRGLRERGGTTETMEIAVFAPGKWLFCLTVSEPSQ